MMDQLDGADHFLICIAVCRRFGGVPFGSIKVYSSSSSMYIRGAGLVQLVFVVRATYVCVCVCMVRVSSQARFFAFVRRVNGARTSRCCFRLSSGVCEAVSRPVAIIFHMYDILWTPLYVLGWGEGGLSLVVVRSQ